MLTLDLPRCELCKQRKVRVHLPPPFYRLSTDILDKVKCDRGHPSCGWCTRNGAKCEYKERKKPGLRAGYGEPSSNSRLTTRYAGNSDQRL